MGPWEFAPLPAWKLSWLSKSTHIALLLGPKVPILLAYLSRPWSIQEVSGIEQIAASGSAFAAIRADGRVETWGDADYGGDSTAVQAQLLSSE